MSIQAATGAVAIPAGSDQSRNEAPAAEIPEVMTAAQAAVFLGVDRKTVYENAARGRIPHRKLGRRLLFGRAALLAWLEGAESASSGSSVGAGQTS